MRRWNQASSASTMRNTQIFSRGFEKIGKLAQSNILALESMENVLNALTSTISSSGSQLALDQSVTLDPASYATLVGLLEKAGEEVTSILVTSQRILSSTLRDT